MSVEAFAGWRIVAALASGFGIQIQIIAMMVIANLLVSTVGLI
jgi:hypothetical protein